MIQKIFENRKQKLEESSNRHASSEADSSACCSFIPEVLCGKSGFESWQDTLPITDRTSFLLDLELLQELSFILLVDPKVLQLVSG